MKNTKNYNLQKPDFNNVADIEVLNDNFDKIDTGITPFYVATLNSTNIYEVATGLSITKLNDGFSVRIAIPSDSTGAVSIIIDGLTAVPVKKANGRAVSNLKANGVYNLTYYKSVFILASGGVDEVNFSTSDLLSGKTANNSDGEKVTGTMPNIGQQTATINAGGKVTISKGYHDGTGYVQSNSMGTQLSNLGVTLTSASQLVNGVKAVNKYGNLITGTATVESLGGKKYKKFTDTVDKIQVNNHTYIPDSVHLPFVPQLVRITCEGKKDVIVYADYSKSSVKAMYCSTKVGGAYAGTYYYNNGKPRVTLDYFTEPLTVTIECWG